MQNNISKEEKNFVYRLYESEFYIIKEIKKYVIIVLLLDIGLSLIIKFI